MGRSKEKKTLCRIDHLVVEEEDRISKLADDIIHHIFSFLDMKYVVQASTLSKRWKLIWTLMPHLNLDHQIFLRYSKFSTFVKRVLSHRNNHTCVNTLDLTVQNLINPLLLEHIINYAYLHNLINFTCRTDRFPEDNLSSHTLKNLTIITKYRVMNVKYSMWDFPALETLNLETVQLGNGNDKTLDIFSKCMNIKDITLHKCDMEGVEIFNICAPQLANLTLTDIDKFPNVLNVVAPQLKNLTVVVDSRKSSRSKINFLQLSTEEFNSLERVNLSMSCRNYREDVLSRLFNLFRIVQSAKFLILDSNIIEFLSTHIDKLSREPSPFNSLKYLKMNVSTLIHTQVINHLLTESQNATLIMDLPKVRQTRSTLPMKVAKLEEKILMKDQVIASQKANIQMKEQVIADQTAHIQLKDEVIANQNANIQMKDQVIENQNTNIQMKDQVIANQKAMIQILKSNNNNMHSDVPAPSPVP